MMHNLLILNALLVFGGSGTTDGTTVQDDLEARVAELEARLAEGERNWSLFSERPLERLSIGGYGEVHANMAEGSSNDQIDIHRFVFYMGYEFTDWIQLHSETEIEHAFISDDDGEISIEQLHVDFQLARGFNVRAGRMLTPLGIINQKHEPPSFNGVERPLFASVIIPSTWSSDGVGVFGRIVPEVRYQAYIVGGLDGSQFSATQGIRGGRIKERPSLNDPAVTGRIDVYPLARRAAPGQTLRIGLSGYGGGIDNGDQGVDPDIDGDIYIGSADFEYSVGILDLRGAGAVQKISGTNQIGGGVAKEIRGYYVEAGVHVLSDSLKTGRWKESDLVLFARYSEVDTQFEVGTGVTKDPAGDRELFTTGFTFFFTPALVFKGDVQIRNDDRAGDLPTLVNLGLGWEF